MNTILTSTSRALDADSLEPFFYSLRLSGYQDDVVIFASQITDDCRALLKKYRATVVDVEYYGMPTLRSRTRRIIGYFKILSRYYLHHRPGEKDFHYLISNCSRFYCYYDYLRNLPKKPDFVFMADVRDIVFQRNPFSFPFETGLTVTTECRTIIQSRGAIKQLWETVGLIETWRIARRDIVNCGTIVADFDTTLKYLETVISYFNRCFFWALIEGIDQAVHTYLVHKQMIGPIHYFNNWKGPFLTLADEIVLPESKNGEGYLCNRDGSVIPVVHQYDRINGLYGEGDKRPDCWKLYRDGWRPGFEPLKKSA